MTFPFSNSNKMAHGEVAYKTATVQERPFSALSETWKGLSWRSSGMFRRVMRRCVGAPIRSSDRYGKNHRNWYADLLSKSEIKDQPGVGAPDGIPPYFDRVIICRMRADHGCRCHQRLMKMNVKRCRGRRMVQVFWVDMKERRLKIAGNQDGRAQNCAG